MGDVTYKLEELAQAAGTSPRTFRYYVQRGLLPAPAFRGRDTAYGHEHLVRLRAIRRLQDAFFPLDAILAELADKSLDAIEKIAGDSALPIVQLEAGPPSTPARGAGELVSPAARRPTKERVFRRIDLAPGVELSVAEDLSPESRAVVERILREVSEGR